MKYLIYLTVAGMSDRAVSLDKGIRNVEALEMFIQESFECVYYNSFYSGSLWLQLKTLYVFVVLHCNYVHVESTSC